MKNVVLLLAALLAAAALLVGLAHWRVGDWLAAQRAQLGGSWHLSVGGYSVNPLAGAVELRDLRIATGPTADYLNIPTLQLSGFTALQLAAGRWPSAAIAFTAPRVELYRRGALYSAWAARAPERCASSGSWADLAVDRGGYLVAALRGELRESDIYGEFLLRAELASAPLGTLALQARLQAGRSGLAELTLNLWPQLEALQLQLRPDRAALLESYRQCAAAAGQSLAQWRAAQRSWQLGPLQLVPDDSAELAGWLADPVTLELAVSRSEYSLAEWLGLAGSFQLAEGSALQWRVGDRTVALAAVATLPARLPASRGPANPSADLESAAGSYQRQPWQQLPAQLGQLAAVYVAQRKEPHRGELVAVDQRGLSLLQRRSEGEVVLPLRRATIVRVETRH